MIKAFTIVAVLIHVHKILGHGRLLEPPSRASMWRMGFKTPKDFDDDQSYCGGLGVQWGENDGRCGICGDAWNDFPREHEAPGGRFATGTIVRRYKAGSWIPVILDITTNHGGYYQFKLCPNNDKRNDPNQQCFNKFKLQTRSRSKGSGGTFLELNPDALGRIKMLVKLPDTVTCDQCILQWTWVAANNWGDCKDGVSHGMGCGPQETFRACSDISIVGNPKGISGETEERPTRRMSPEIKRKVTEIQMLGKIISFIKTRKKEKSAMVSRLKLLRLKRKLLEEQSEQKKSPRKQSGRSMFSGTQRFLQNKTLENVGKFGFIPPNKKLLLTQMNSQYFEDDLDKKNTKQMLRNKVKNQFQKPKKLAYNFKNTVKKDYIHDFFQKWKNPVKKNYKDKILKDLTYPEKVKSSLVREIVTKGVGEILRSATTSRTQLENSLMRSESLSGKGNGGGNYVKVERGQGKGRSFDAAHLVQILSSKTTQRPSPMPPLSKSSFTYFPKSLLNAMEGRGMVIPWWLRILVLTLQTTNK